MTLAYQTISTTAQIDFTTTSNRIAVRSCVTQIEAYAGGSRNLTFNASWVPLGVVFPASLSANKVGILSLISLGTAETDIRAVFTAQP